MRRLLKVLAAIVALTGGACATEAAQSQVSLTPGSNDTWNVDWSGVAGRTYFIQWSLDLQQWDYAPTMDFGPNPASYGIDTGGASKFFIRLRYTDQGGITTLAGAKTADFDGDKVSNHDEILNGTDPFENVDTDGDGLPNDWETSHGLNPNDPADGLLDDDGDGDSNVDEFVNDTNPTNPNDSSLPPPPPLPLKIRIFTYASLGPTYPQPSTGLKTPYTIRIFEQNITTGVETQVHATTYGGSSLFLTVNAEIPNIIGDPNKRYTVQMDLPTIGTGVFDQPYRDWSFFIAITANVGSGSFAIINGFNPSTQQYGSSGHILGTPTKPFNPGYESFRAIIAPTDLISDTNNDGLLTTADNALRDDSFKSGATSAEIEKGTEFLFFNDQVSNGAWDREDTDPSRPPSKTNDDDAKEIELKPGIAEGEVWLDHPAIAGLSFYKNRSCKPGDKVNMSPTQHLTINADNPFPDRLFVRADGTFSFPASNPQVEGDLKLFIKPIGGAAAGIETAKFRLTIVKHFGALKFFYAARDYILENNTTLFTRPKEYYPGGMFQDAGVAILTTMRQEATIMRALDSYHLPTKLYGIDAVTASYPSSTVIINGNMTFDEQDIGLGRLLTRRCHGRLVSAGVYNSATSSDNPDENVPPPNMFGIPSPLRGSELAGPDGKYISMISNGVFQFNKGRVPLTPLPTEALGGLSTNYSVQNADQLMGIAPVGTDFQMLFTSTNLSTTTGITSEIANDARSSGVEALPGGASHELKLFKLDGGSSLALSYSNPSGLLKTPIKGSKHTGRFLNDYCIHTYLMLKATSAR